MRIIIRTDASLRIGSGHLMRCRTLAEELQQQGAEVRFVCRLHSGHLMDLLRGAFQVHELPSPPVDTRTALDEDYAAWLGVSQEQDATDTITFLNLKDWRPDWLIVDHYALDKTWESALRLYVGRIMVIDDLADRVHDCDLLLDQNLYPDMETRYNGLVPSHCQTLLGPKYALLRREFREARRNLRVRTGEVKRILVFFGGTDPTNETAKMIQALKTLNLSCIVDVVVGSMNPNKDVIKQECLSLEGFNYYEQTNNMAELMVQADLAIGAGGSTTWERCCVGLPTIVKSTAKNQNALIATLKAKLALLTLPIQEEFDSNLKLLAFLLIENKAILETIQKNCLDLCDASGGKRVMNVLLPKKILVRRAILEDAKIIFAWRNNQLVREFSLNKNEIEWNTHLNWLKTTLARTDRILLIAELFSAPVGVVRFDIYDNSAEVSIFINPEYIDSGLGKVVYSDAEVYLRDWVSRTKKNLIQLKAVVLENNFCSQNFFVGLGYKKTSCEYLKELK